MNLLYSIRDWVFPYAFRFGIVTIALYTQLKTKTYNVYVDFYTNNEYFKSSSDFITNSIKTIYAKLNYCYVEPSGLWGSIVWIKNVDGVYEYNNVYTSLPEYGENYIRSKYDFNTNINYLNEACLKDINKNFQSMYLRSKNILNEEELKNPYLLMIKTQSVYLYRFIHKSIYYDIDFSKIKKTPNFFLSIKYIHPKMTSDIFIELDDEHFVENNQILSAEFILRYLKHQPQEFVFDDNYVVEILDKKMKFSKINRLLFVELFENEYNVVTI